jgi:hypothetical protein
MAIIQLQLRQGPEAQRAQLTPLEGEMIYTTDTKMLFVGDGVTAGGNALRAPMPSQGTADSSDLVASTRFVQQALANVTGTNLSDYARKGLDNSFTANNSFVNPPTISGVIPSTDSSTKVPTTAWVRSQIDSIGSLGNVALRDQANTFSSINDFTVSPTAPTPAVNDSSSKVATTAFVKNVLNSNGLGLSTIVITAGTGTAINYSAGTVTLPNGLVVNITPAGSLSLPSSGNYYITVDSNAAVAYTSAYPSGSGIRVIATVSVASGSITGLDLSGTDLSSYAKLSGAEFSGPIKAPTPLATVDDTTLATTEWVNNKLESGASDLVRESTSNSYQAGTTQDFTLSTITVPPLAPTDDSNKAASTSFVRDAIDTALSGGADLTQYARKDGATFTGIARGPLPLPNADDNQFATTEWVKDVISTENLDQYAEKAGTTFTGIARGPIPTNFSSDDQFATTSWVRDVLDDMIIGGDLFPSLTARPGTRIIDHGVGRIRISNSNTCSISAEDIEIPANQTVWIYVDPTCGINHYPFTSLAVKPPTGKAFAYASSNATQITSITMLQPDTIVRGNVVIENDLTINGSIYVPGGISVTTPPPGDNDNSVATTAWVKGLIDNLLPVGSIKIYWWPASVISDAYGMVWALCNGQPCQQGWVWGNNNGVLIPGSTVPDFRDRFLMQEGISTPFGIGGTNNVVLGPNNIPAHAHAMTTNHQHEVAFRKIDADNNSPGNQGRYLYDIGVNSQNLPNSTGHTGKTQIEDNPFITDTRYGNGVGAADAFDNRPAYHTTHYYLRVK